MRALLPPSSERTDAQTAWVTDQECALPLGVILLGDAATKFVSIGHVMRPALTRQHFWPGRGANSGLTMSVQLGGVLDEIYRSSS